MLGGPHGCRAGRGGHNAVGARLGKGSAAHHSCRGIGGTNTSASSLASPSPNAASRWMNAAGTGQWETVGSIYAEEALLGQRLGWEPISEWMGTGRGKWKFSEPQGCGLLRSPESGRLAAGAKRGLLCLSLWAGLGLPRGRGPSQIRAGLVTAAGIGLLPSLPGWSPSY